MLFINFININFTIIFFGIKLSRVVKKRAKYCFKANICTLRNALLQILLNNGLLVILFAKNSRLYQLKFSDIDFTFHKMFVAYTLTTFM